MLCSVVAAVLAVVQLLSRQDSITNLEDSRHSCV